MPIFITLAITKLVRALVRLAGKGGGGALPGVWAEKLDPHLAGKLAAGLPHGSILVTGTNGKTTTTKLIAGVLAANGEQVVTNSTGSNMKRGVTSALIAASSLRGKVRGTIGLFEVDEASLRHVAPELAPKHIVVLNLFRDQLDRYGELDTTAAMIGQGIAATRASLYLNADDPLVASLAKYAASTEKVNFFGIEGLPAKTTSAHKTAADSDRCPICHNLLTFSRVFYGHIGHYKCSEGDFARPQPGVAITDVIETTQSGTKFNVAVNGHRSEVNLPLPGTYNLYNALAAESLAHGLGIETLKVKVALAETGAAFGRVEKLELLGRTVYLLLIKNPAGFTQVLETFFKEGGERVLFAINDLDADGRDVSWLWDVPLEMLAPLKPKVVVTGIRAADMVLRLHYAGVESEQVDEFGEAIDALVRKTPAGGTAYVLPTYTSMLAIRKLLSKRTQMQEIWK